MTPEEWERNNWTLVATIPWSNSKSAQGRNASAVLCVLERRLSGLEGDQGTEAKDDSGPVVRVGMDILVDLQIGHPLQPRGKLQRITELVNLFGLERRGLQWAADTQIMNVENCCPTTVRSNTKVATIPMSNCIAWALLMLWRHCMRFTWKHADQKRSRNDATWTDEKGSPREVGGALERPPARAVRLNVA